MRLLALLFGNGVWKLWSPLMAVVLRLRGVKVGRGFYCEGIPRLALRGSAGQVTIADDVSFLGDVDLRNRENGAIELRRGCRIDTGVRLVAAREARLIIGEDSRIGCYSVFNCGADVTVGKKVLISGFVYVQSSSHGIRAGFDILDQPHEHLPIRIGDGAWLGSHVSVLPGTVIGDGAVIGSKAVARGQIPPSAVAVGVPAKVIRLREQEKA